MLLCIFFGHVRHTSCITGHIGKQTWNQARACKVFLCVCCLHQEKAIKLILNASRENTSSTDIYEDKLDEPDRKDAKITWEDGRQLFELGVLAKGLEACIVWKKPL